MFFYVMDINLQSDISFLCFVLFFQHFSWPVYSVIYCVVLKINLHEITCMYIFLLWNNLHEVFFPFNLCIPLAPV